MAKVKRLYVANDGAAHETPEAATIADLCALFGETGMAKGFAAMVFDKRAEIETIFREFDEIAADLPQ